MNVHAIRAIYFFEMARTFRTLVQSIVSPVITTSLYFIVFGAAIGSRMTEIDGVPYGAFIVPGLIMLSVLTESISNGSFGIYFPKFTGTIYELLSAPISITETVIGYVGAAATKSVLIGLIIFATAHLFVPMLPPFWRTVTLFNPVVYLISGFRWAFFGTADVGIAISLTMTLAFLALCLTTVWGMFRTGYKLKA